LIAAAEGVVVAALEGALRPAPPLEGGALVPLVAVHVLDRDERAAVEAVYVVVLMPDDTDALPASPDGGGLAGRVAGQTLPYGGTGTLAPAALALAGDLGVGEGITEVGMGADWKCGRG